MKALTICQPYAGLIEDELKRVENRTWYCSYRGPLAIHAGKSKQWLETYSGHSPRRIVFGAIVATATVVACFAVDYIRKQQSGWQFNWLNTHEHTVGPYCIVLDNVKRFDSPIYCKGALGLWNWKE